MKKLPSHGRACTLKFKRSYSPGSRWDDLPKGIGDLTASLSLLRPVIRLALRTPGSPIHRITNHRREPILKVSLDHATYLSAREVRIQCEAELPGLKARRDRLREHLETLDSTGG